MSALIEPSAWEDATATSAMGPIGGGQVLWVVLVAGSLLPATSSNASPRFLEGAVVMESDATSSGAGEMSEPIEMAESTSHEATRAALTTLRRLTGLTWDQIARLFNVSRRSVHFWASGKPMTSEHEEHLHRLLAVVRGANRSADALRAALLSVVDGEQVLGLLMARRYDVATVVLGTGDARVAVPRTPLSASVEEARRPLAPEDLAVDEGERSYPIDGRGHAVPAVRGKGRGQS
jgi:DNA-binding transcriptional regulator YiaG